MMDSGQGVSIDNNTSGFDMFQLSTNHRFKNPQRLRGLLYPFRTYMRGF